MEFDEKGASAWRPRQLTPEGPRYLALVTALEQDLSEGRLTEGSRLPPHRELAQQLGLAVGTVGKAYQEAEKRGLLSGRVGQGTFVRRRPPSRPHRNFAQEPVNMALNVPAKGSETGILTRAFSDLADSKLLGQHLGYQPHGGNWSHREIVAEHLSGTSLGIEPKRMFFCNGAQHAIDVAVRLTTQAGDPVLVDGLTYSGFKAIAAANRLKLVPVQIDGQGIVPESLVELCKRSGSKILYCMPTLHSPTARTMGAKRREQIAEIAQQHQLTIIEDDVYGFFLPERPVTITELVPERSFYITSYSKCVAPGFRLGTLTVPRGLAEETELLLHASSWFAPPLLSEIVVRLHQNGQFNEILQERRRQAFERYHRFSEAFPTVEKLAFPPFFGWLPLPPEWSSEELVSAARRHNILLTPPIASSVDDAEPGAVRVCLGAPEHIADLTEALCTLQGVLNRSPPNLLSVA